MERLANIVSKYPDIETLVASIKGFDEISDVDDLCDSLEDEFSYFGEYSDIK